MFGEFWASRLAFWSSTLRKYTDNMGHVNVIIGGIGLSLVHECRFHERLFPKTENVGSSVIRLETASRNFVKLLKSNRTKQQKL